MSIYKKNFFIVIPCNSTQNYIQQMRDSVKNEIKIILVVCTMSILLSELLFKLWLKIDVLTMPIRALGDIPFNILASLFTIIPFSLTCKTPLRLSIIWAIFLTVVFDVDHFITAGSIHLSDAISLPYRPVNHSFVIVFFFAVVLSVLTRSREVGIISLFSLCSHLFRDVWNGKSIIFYPLSSSSYQLSYLLCIVLLIFLPTIALVCGFLIMRMSILDFWFIDSEGVRWYKMPEKITVTIKKVLRILLMDRLFRN